MKNKLLVWLAFLAGPSITAWGQVGPVPLIRYAEKQELTEKQQNFRKVIDDRPTTLYTKVITINMSDASYVEIFKLEGLDEYQTLFLEKSQLEMRSPNHFSWMGTVQGHSLSTANLVFDGEYVHATIQLNGALFAIQPIGEGLHVLIRQSADQFEDEGCRALKKQNDLKPSENQEDHQPGQHKGGNFEAAQALGGCGIRLLVAFTDDVATANVNPRGTIQLATDNYNTANQNSNVDHRAFLARVIMVNFAESGDATTDRDLFMGNGDGILDNIHDIRDLYDADMCCLIAQDIDGCGLAADIGASYGTAFQVTEFGCAAGNLTFAHEFGHLLNCRHDTFADATAGTNHGMVNVANTWRTVMAYNDECASFGVDCNRLMFWSNPAVTISGSPSGLVGRCENRSAINAYDNTVAAFESLVNNKTLTAGETIADDEEANHVASQTIQNNSGIAIQYASGSRGCYQAGTSITLRPGFWARQGTDFRAYLDACNDVLPKASTVYSGNESGSRSEENTRLQASTAAFEVYPNPAKDACNIVYSLASTCDVRIDLFDAYGRMIANLASRQSMPPGTHTVRAETSAFPSGIYFIRLGTCSFSESRSITIGQ